MGDCLLQGRFVQLLVGRILQKGGKLSQAVGNFGHSVLVVVIGHIQIKVGDAVMLRQPPEGQVVGIAGNGGAGSEQRLARRAGKPHAQQSFVVAAQRGADACALGIMDKAALGCGTVQVTGGGFGKHRQQVEGVQQFTGHKDIDQRRPLRVGQGRNHGVHGDLCRILPRGGELFFRGKQQLHILGAVAQQQQLAGKLRLGNGVIHQLAKAVNDIWHRGYPFST